LDINNTALFSFYFSSGISGLVNLGLTSVQNSV